MATEIPRIYRQPTIFELKVRCTSVSKRALVHNFSYKMSLRRNPPEVRVTSGQKSTTKIIYIVLQTSVRMFQISSRKQIISSNSKRRK